MSGRYPTSALKSIGPPSVNLALARSPGRKCSGLAQQTAESRGLCLDVRHNSRRERERDTYLARRLARRCTGGLGGKGERTRAGGDTKPALLSARDARDTIYARGMAREESCPTATGNFPT